MRVCDGVEKINFDTIIDELDDKSLIDFHKKLIEMGCYEGQLNLADFDENNTDQLKKAVKIGVQGTEYQKLKEFAPDIIKAHIKTLEETQTATAQHEPIPKTIDKTVKKEKLIQELLQISAQRDRRKRIPPLLRPRYEEVVTQLNTVYGMTFLEISDLSGMDRQTLSKDVDSYLKEHPIITPDEKVLTGAEKRAADKLTKVVGATADQIIEDDMELAIHIRQTFLKDAYLRNMSLRQLVDVAIPMFFRTPDLYTTMLGMEREIIMLRTRLARLSTINKNLSYKLININGFSGGQNG